MADSSIIFKPNLNVSSLVMALIIIGVIIFFVLHYLVCLLTSIQMPINMKAGPGLIIAHPDSIVFSEKATLGSFVTIYQCCTIGKTFSGANPIIGDFVTIFTGSNV